MVSAIQYLKCLESQPTGIGSGYLREMQKFLVDLKLAADSSDLIRLPSLCCLALGGDETTAEKVTAAWQIFYATADLLDKIADADEMPYTPAVATNLATGFLISAFNVLIATTPDIQADFCQSILKMCLGQHFALTHTQLTLQECWQMAEFRSGAFFALGCRSGAKLVCDNAQTIGHLETFGNELGMLIQIANDIGGLWEHHQSSDLRSKMRWTLPVAYTMSVASPETCERLMAYLEAAPSDNTAEIQARNLIIESGALVYFKINLQQRRQRAQDALAACLSDSPTKQNLLSLVDKFANIKISPHP